MEVINAIAVFVIVLVMPLAILLPLESCYMKSTTEVLNDRSNTGTGTVMGRKVVRLLCRSIEPKVLAEVEVRSLLADCYSH
jgi:hypothetical protein